MPKDNNDNFKLASLLSLAGQLGFDIVIPILVTAWIGRYLDNRFFAGQYIFTLLLQLFGGIFSIWSIYKMIVPLIDRETNTGKGDQKDKDNEDKKAK